METMRCVHMVAYSVQGVILPSGEHELLSCPADGLTAIITSALDNHAEAGDRSSAVAEGLLSGLFHADREAAMPARMVASVSRAREARAKRFGGGPFVVLRREVDVDVAIGVQRKIPGATICFDAIDKDAVRADSRPVFAAALAALASLAEPVCGFEKATDFVVLRKPDGTDVFTFTATFGDAILSTTVAPNVLSEIPRRYDMLRKATSLGRVIRLIQQSLEQRKDRFRAFLAAWNALEILVNKVFPYYEEAFFSELAASSGQARAAYAERIRTVMKDKYNVADRFALIASALSPTACETDLQTFRKAKRFRDKLSHGEDILDSLLPVEDTRRLVQRYFAMHAVT